MEMTHCSSIDDWVKKLKAFPLWAILSGFSPDDVPGVGTFYDFLKRLWLADSPYLSKKVRKPKRKPKKGKKRPAAERDRQGPGRPPARRTGPPAV